MLSPLSSASSTSFALLQKKEMLHHLVDHQQHQEGKSLEECNISVITTTTTTTTAAATTTTAAATGTSDDNSLMKRNISMDKESIKKMDYGHLNRGTCSSPNDACVPQNKAIEEDGYFFEPEDASYASSGYCVPLSFLEGIEYKNGATTTMSLIDKEKFKKEEEMTDSYYHYHPQYDHHHRQLDSSLNCTSFCSGDRPDVSRYVTDNSSFPDLIYNCIYEDSEDGQLYNDEDCPLEYDNISCWNTTGITDMNGAFNIYYVDFNAPLECWNVGQVTTMRSMFYTFSYQTFNQPIDSWDVSQVKDMSSMFKKSYFNQPIDSGNVSQVLDMRGMFYRAEYFNQPLDTWNVSKVRNMASMFFEADRFNQPIESWDVSQVKIMNRMFQRSFFNQSIDSWDVSQVTDMGSMFSEANS